MRHYEAVTATPPNPRRGRSRRRNRSPGAQPVAATPTPVAPRRVDPANRDGERNLRDLVGAGPSQLGVSGSLRGRDADRPTPADLAEAERDLVIVRRNWTPER
jgi:hypothetical protein